ncbi:MAG: hypothetical protein L6R38_009716, partial [Xanthoria sp. 2 TBL-2021]
MDSAEFSSLVNDYDQARAFRLDTLNYTKRCLVADVDPALPKVPENASIVSFGPIGEAISTACTSSQIETFLEEIVFFVEMTDVEQQVQMSGKLPSVEEYKRRRMGSSAVGVCLALTETNDLLSIRKEIKQGQVDTLIPLLYAQYGTLEVSTDKAIETLKTSVTAFELSAQKLLGRYRVDVELWGKLKKFVHACQCACTANLTW